MGTGIPHKFKIWWARRLFWCEEQGPQVWKQAVLPAAGRGGSASLTWMLSLPRLKENLDNSIKKRGSWTHGNYIWLMETLS